MSIIIAIYKALSHISLESQNSPLKYLCSFERREKEIQKDWTVAKTMYLMSRKTREQITLSPLAA